MIGIMLYRQLRPFILGAGHKYSRQALSDFSLAVWIASEPSACRWAGERFATYFIPAIYFYFLRM
jgi:hypothetical protein